MTMSISEFTQQDYEVIARDYADLKESAVKRCANQSEMEVVQKAFEFANEAHKGVRRRSGEPYILHPIAVAKIVVTNIGLGYKSIAAALLHDVVEDTDYTVDDIRNLFGDRIALLVDGLTKIKVVLDNDAKAGNRSIQAEGVFGAIKQDMAYTRLRRTSLPKAELEIMLMCLGFNIRKHMRFLSGNASFNYWRAPEGTQPQTFKKPSAKRLANRVAKEKAKGVNEVARDSHKYKKTKRKGC